jgi:hypothetical protein
MRILLEAIKFNHDLNSATADAFNIRKNETQSVTLPEWRRGVSHQPEDSPAAYAICETFRMTITIQAKFKCDDPSVEAIQVQAVDPRVERSESLGCNPAALILRMALPDQPPPRVRNVLGVVKERPVRFDAHGETDFLTFELQDVRLSSVGVSVSTTEWCWQFRLPQSDRWTDFETTSHRIYTVLKVPTCPWMQEPFDTDNTQLPWTDVLERACLWAASAKDPDEAATLITHNVYNLGTTNLVTYSGSPFYSDPTFDCTKFLELLRGNLGIGQTFNCSDCATIVSSLANILGCDLWQSTIGGVFFTNSLKLIGHPSPSRPDIFTGHEVAWEGECRENNELFDACLQVDNDFTTRDFEPLLPTNLIFGRPDDPSSYRFRLSPLPLQGQMDPCSPSPQNRQRRKIGKQLPGEGKKLDEGLLNFLKGHYDYDKWYSLEPPTDHVSVEQLFAQSDLFQGFRLDFIQHPKKENVVEVTQALWRSIEDADVLLRVDIFQSRDCDEARLLLLHQLGEFQIPNLKRLEPPPIGDVAFVEPEGISVLFALSDYVFLVRSAGKRPISIMQVAFQLNQQVIQ